MRKRNFRNNKAITLIALVITIIVLLLLAGISISIISGQDGILNKAAKAKQKTAETEYLDKVKLAVQNEMVEGLGEVDVSNLESDLKEILEDTTLQVEVTDTEYIIRSEKGEYNINKVNGSVSIGNFNLPMGLNDSFFKQVKISYDNKNYTTDFDVANLKNESKTTYYLKPTGNDSNDGLTKDTPFQRLSKALSVCESGDTIILLEGIYSLGHWATPINKSVNIIGENENVYVKQGNNRVFTQNGEYNNIYQAPDNNVWQLLDVTDKQNIEVLTEVASIEDCNSTDASYYSDGTNVYINMKEDRVPTNENIVINRGQNVATISVYKLTENVKVYFENITVWGGQRGCIGAYNNDGYIPTILGKNCKFLYSKTDVDENGAGFSAVTMRGCNSIFQNCEASYSNNDGFNYHSYHSVLCNSIEINCVASNNGIGWHKATCNGSTTHDGNKILRIGGEYYNSYGGNVADVNEGTVSANYSCYAHDSISGTKGAADTDFVTQNAGAIMYLYSCKADGNSAYNVYAVADTQIFVNGCQYNNTGGEGDIVED